MKICIVDYPHQADYCVCLVDGKHKQKNEELIEGADLVRSVHQADIAICLVDRPHKADICITGENFPVAA